MVLGNITYTGGMARWKPDARRRLVDAAVELFSTQGYDSTGVAQIAEHAGLTKTTFFRHFLDKREVLFAGEADHCQTLADAMADAPATATPLEAVAAGLDAMAASFPNEHREFAAKVRAIVASSSELQERASLKSAIYAATMADALRERGVPDPTAIVAADLGVRAFTSAFAEWADSDTSASLAELASQSLGDLHAASLVLR